MHPGSIVNYCVYNEFKSRINIVVNGYWTTEVLYVHSPESVYGHTMRIVKHYTQKASFPIVLMHVAFITFLSLSMVMSIPTIR